ncbi:MAG: Alpha/beta hydrolase family protein [Syntrophorhabdaceae bacterium PtaU1.Bin034]|nr:MAG: Alpha/beta hydrolase family protein [Syntrophorhabdaceae bacterium PtaU1.Bin034]
MQSGIETRQVTIRVDDKNQTSGVITSPSGTSKNIAVVLAHGAGNDMTHALMVAFSDGLAHAGYPVLRFNFLYAERGRKAPDQEPLLSATWAAAYRFLKDDGGLAAGKVVAAGKSMGGRIASQMAADGRLQAERLVFLGYPLHRAGDVSTLRDRHLYGITIPMLFIEGTRDPLCDLRVLDSVLTRLKAPRELFTIEGGDHSFHVPKSARMTDEEVYDRIVTRTVEWLSR